MSPLYRYNGKLLQRYGKLATSEKCCCKEECFIEEFGLYSPSSGWTTKDIDALPKTLPIAVAFKFEDSTSEEYGLEPCNGSNGEPQSGQIFCYFTLSEESQVQVVVNGNVETHNPGFDRSSIFINNDGARPDEAVVSIFSTKNNLQGCIMEYADDAAVISLPAGIHRYIFRANTGDAAWHKDMTHSFSITLF